MDKDNVIVDNPENMDIAIGRTWCHKVRKYDVRVISVIENIIQYKRYTPALKGGNSNRAVSISKKSFIDSFAPSKIITNPRITNPIEDDTIESTEKTKELKVGSLWHHAVKIVDIRGKTIKFVPVADLDKDPLDDWTIENKVDYFLEHYTNLKVARPAIEIETVEKTENQVCSQLDANMESKDQMIFIKPSAHNLIISQIANNSPLTIIDAENLFNHFHSYDTILLITQAIIHCETWASLEDPELRKSIINKYVCQYLSGEKSQKCYISLPLSDTEDA